MSDSDKGAWGKRLATVAGGLGVVPAAQVDTTRRVPEPRPMTAKEASALMTAELLQAIRGVVDSTTELTARIGRQGAVNGVLDVALVVLDASGLYTVDYPVTVGSLVVVNHDPAAALVVHSGPPSSSAPTVGRGVQRCPAGGRLVMPVADRTFGIWGTPAASFSLQVFTGLQPYGAGAL